MKSFYFGLRFVEECGMTYGVICPPFELPTIVLWLYEFCFVVIMFDYWVEPRLWFAWFPPLPPRLLFLFSKKIICYGFRCCCCFGLWNPPCVWFILTSFTGGLGLDCVLGKDSCFVTMNCVCPWNLFCVCICCWFCWFCRIIFYFRPPWIWAVRGGCWFFSCWFWMFCYLFRSCCFWLSGTLFADGADDLGLYL